MHVLIVRCSIRRHRLIDRFVGSNHRKRIISHLLHWGFLVAKSAHSQKRRHRSKRLLNCFDVPVGVLAVDVTGVTDVLPTYFFGNARVGGDRDVGVSKRMKAKVEELSLGPNARIVIEGDSCRF